MDIIGRQTCLHRIHRGNSIQAEILKSGTDYLQVDEQRITKDNSASRLFLEYQMA